MSKSVEIAPDQPWFLKSVEGEGIFVKINDHRLKTKNDYLTEEILEVKPHPTKSYQRYVLITFRVPNSPSGQKAVRFDLANLDQSKTAYEEELSTVTMSAKDFSRVLQRLNPLVTSKEETVHYETPGVGEKIGNPSVRTPSPSIRRKRISDNEVDLPSPEKKVKAADIDQEIDSHYLGNMLMKVDGLSDFCPKTWLDRELDSKHVKELEEILKVTPTAAKSQQPWIGIADIAKADLKSKEVLKGCRITVIGGRHRHAAYKNVMETSEIHKKELDRVWIHLYDNKMSDSEIRRLAAMHNVTNVGSMPTSWTTRVHSCRQWLFTMAGKNLETDDTPPSMPDWKKACQKMYVPSDKDPNTLEPTLQAALLPKEVYQEFQRVSQLFSAGELKDQKLPGKGKGKKNSGRLEIAQSQLGMPLQGLADKTKLDLLKQVSKKEMSLKDLKHKIERIKKKRLVVNAFLKHAGEETWEALTHRFPLHATEEKLAQFSDTPITKTKIPQEVVSFFERAIKWENDREINIINLHEEREGVYIYERHSSIGVLMEGSFQNLPLEQIKRLITSRSFKGFSLIIAYFPAEMTKKDLCMFLTNIHAANVDSMTSYNIAIVTVDSQVQQVQDVLENRCSSIQLAFWINTKIQRLQGYKMPSSICPIVFGHWAKDGAITEAHCHFDDEENASNAFCFDSDDKELPNSLIGHIIKHFSYEGQWILDLTGSKVSGLVSALNHGRSCVSLMIQDELRKAAAVTVQSVQAIKEDRIQGSSDEEE